MCVIRLQHSWAWLWFLFWFAWTGDTLGDVRGEVVEDALTRHLFVPSIEMEIHACGMVASVPLTSALFIDTPLNLPEELRFGSIDNGELVEALGAWGSVAGAVTELERVRSIAVRRKVLWCSRARA
jgi:hypothetical protein